MTIDRSSRGLAQNTAFVLGAELIVQATRAATVFVLFGVFGEERFGVYAGILALLTLLGPASQWGMNHVTVRAIARGDWFGEAWAKATTTILWGGVLGSLIATAIGILWFDLAPIYLLLFSFAQLIGFGSAQAATMAAEAHHRADVGLWINISGAVIRMSALGLFLMFGNRTLEQWSIVLFAAMVVWGAWSLLRVALSFGGVHARRPPSRHELRLGAGFVFVQTSSSGQTDVDKIVLNAYDLRADAGIYSPGYRIAEMATVPLVALVRATYAEFFRRGSTAVSEALSFARRLTLIAVGYGVVAGAALYVLAPLVEIIASEAVVEPVRWLAFIPLVKGLQYFPGNVLTGADHHQVRSWIIFVTFVVNVVGNLLFIPEHGWKAAALTTLGAESLFAVLLWTAVAVISRRERMERSGA